MSTPVPVEAVEAVMEALGCMVIGSPAHGQRCMIPGHNGPWTDRGCPVAVKVAAAVVAALGHPDDQASLARAWAEGKTAGLEQAADHVRTGRPNIRTNPYGRRA